MKIFLGLDDTCGYYTNLQNGLNEIGVSSTLVNAFCNSKYKLNNNAGSIGNFVEWVGAKTNSSKRGSFLRFFWVGIKIPSLLALLIWTLPQFDTYIFSGGFSFLGSYDLWLLKLLKKRIIIVYHGSDSRAPYISPFFLNEEGHLKKDLCLHATKKMKKKLKKIESYADVIISNPGSSHLFEKKIINWFSIGIPNNFLMTQKTNEMPLSLYEAPCKIVHAPTRPIPKGTPQIEKAIQSLRMKGHNIEFIKIIGQPNSKVLEALENCDFVVDELFSDVFMAAFATEAASFGKPTVVGVYEHEKIAEFISDKNMIPPVMLCTVDEVEAAIEKLIVDKTYRLQLGSDARDFVNNQWNNKAVAERFVCLAENKIPESWWFEPKKIHRLYGWGLSDIKSKQIIRTLIDEYGVSALQISHNPDLEQKFIAFSQEN